MIVVENLSKRIGRVQALDGLNFSAEDGAITGLLGPNGAGKTTCLRTLFNLLAPDQGRALVDDIVVAEQPLAAKGHLGLFPDPFGLYERLTPREYIHYMAELNGVNEAIDKAVQETLALLNMEDIADRPCKGFSQGQRMKTALAQAIVHRPKNIVLDEPTRGLDVMSTRKLRSLLLELKAQGHCILFSSHVMQEVSALCDRVVVMAKGKAVAQGSPGQLCEQTGQSSLEEAFIQLIGSDEGIAA
ncbi:MAG: ATP-binding cassette domain-containing protein [Cellvibrionaceae bacterium]|nr:ATP-binding cassette domain-containing protein [Cellvibrionaceae bacterium]MCV6626021.1 ATP-binding cassette domain-containing protein [Cellvibrionaceae bacterium]